MTNKQLFRSDLKTLGLITLTEDVADKMNMDDYKEYIKVLFLPEGYKIQVDMTEYLVTQPALFFVSPNQYLQLKKIGSEGGYFIFYNRDFYCIQLHDDEVACDGLLFNNIHNMPMVELDEVEKNFIAYIFSQMSEEFGLHDTSFEEMIRTYLKQLFIKSARLWKKQNLDMQLTEKNSEVDFFRKFSLLVEEHYKHKHNVAEYAELLFIAPKTIAHKFKRLNLPQPNEFIKNRILLEAKRLLVYTNLTAKEIGYQLGYDDPAYFSRLFVLKTGETPSSFRTKFLSEN